MSKVKDEDDFQKDHLEEMAEEESKLESNVKIEAIVYFRSIFDIFNPRQSNVHMHQQIIHIEQIKQL